MLNHMSSALRVLLIAMTPIIPIIGFADAPSNSGSLEPATVGPQNQQKLMPVKNLENLLKNFHSMHALFHEVSVGEAQDPDHPMLLDGELWIQKPGKFYWQNLSPSSDWFMSNGDTLWHYDPELLQATQSPLASAMSETPLLLLSGEVSDISDLFMVQESSEASTGAGRVEEFILTPRQDADQHSDGMIQSMSLKFLNGNLSSFSLQSQLGQETTVTFSNISWNQDIPASKFEFVLPEGADLFQG